MNFFNENQYVRECTLALKEFDIRMAEYAYAEAAIDTRLKINLAKSELKVMMESTADNYMKDLVYLYTEAGKDAKEKSDATSAGLWQSIKDLFTKIWNAIQHPFTGKNTPGYDEMLKRNGKIKMGFDPNSALDSLDQMLNTLSPAAAAKDGKKIISVILDSGTKIYAGYRGLKFITSKVKKKTDDGTEVEIISVDGVVPDQKETVLTAQDAENVRQKGSKLIGKFNGIIGSFEKLGDKLPGIKILFEYVSNLARKVSEWISTNIIGKITASIAKFKGKGDTDQNQNTDQNNDQQTETPANGQNANPTPQSTPQQNENPTTQQNAAPVNNEQTPTTNNHQPQPAQ